MNEFLALDVETANPDLASICQIGLVGCADGVFIEDWKSYIDPDDYFDPVNICIHGIDESTVSGAPSFAEVAERLGRVLTGKVVACHTSFDRVAIGRAFERCGLTSPECIWLDTACVARRTWDEISHRGWGLENVCALIGYEYEAHDALEDARAAAQVVFAAMKKTGFDLEGWLRRVQLPIHSEQSSIRREGNSAGPLWGETIVFTGALTMARHEAATRASNSGCKVDDNVTKRTTLLVVGDQDIRRLAGKPKSGKHQKAEELISKGVPIRILTEKDFLRMTGVPSQETP